MLDGTNRVTFQDVYVLTRNDAGVLCGVNGKVVCIPHRRLLPGSDIAAAGAHGTVVLERVFAQVLELLPPESGYRHRPGRHPDTVARVFGIHTILPSQLGPRRTQAGIRALYVELLRDALREAGVVRRLAPLHPRRRALAVAWLTGMLDGEVVLPVAIVCDALGIDASVLAATVRARVAPGS